MPLFWRGFSSASFRWKLNILKPKTDVAYRDNALDPIHSYKIQGIIASENYQYWESIRCHLYFHFIVYIKWEEQRDPMN